MVLASASETRRRLLEAAGIPAIADPSGVDEGAIKARAREADRGPDATALTLADAKALTVSRRHHGALVIGADQILVCGTRVFDKAASREQAAETLKFLRGRSHRLISAVTVALDGLTVWRHAENAWLTMRPFSDAFLARYLEEAGDAVVTSVGAYRIEGPGIQLFSQVAGDHFAILGLPLLPLMKVLREQGALAP
ncbi:MAG: Maf family protein [Allosphingosinicella sp.]